MSASCSLMSYPLGYTHHLRVVSLTLFVLFFAFFIPSAVDASVPNQIQRIEIREKPSFTRISFKLTNEPRFKVSKLTNNRLRISLLDTDSSLFKSLRRYSDSNIGGLLMKRRGDDVLITFAQYQVGTHGGLYTLKVFRLYRLM